MKTPAPHSPPTALSLPSPGVHCMTRTKAQQKAVPGSRRYRAWRCRGCAVPFALPRAGTAAAARPPRTPRCQTRSEGYIPNHGVFLLVFPFLSFFFPFEFSLFSATVLIPRLGSGGVYLSCTPAGGGTLCPALPRAESTQTSHFSKQIIFFFFLVFHCGAATHSLAPHITAVLR